MDGLERTYSLFKDDESKRVMCEFLRTYMSCGVYSLQQCDGRIKYIYGCGEDEKYEKLF